MKTKDRILQVCLSLFNEQGEVDQTAVDISNELGISPGNLYYHFKGKDAIIRALFDRFEEEMQIILNSAEQSVVSVEDNWIFIYIILEEIYDFRFFYRDLGVLLARYPDLATRFNALLDLKMATLDARLKDLSDRDVVRIDPRLKPAIVDQILHNLTYWLSFDSVTGRKKTGAQAIHQTVFRIMCLIVPHMSDDQSFENILEYYEQATT